MRRSTLSDQEYRLVARRAAARLTDSFGPAIRTSVEDALDARSDRFVDPVALGSLIVAVATLAWQIFGDVRWRNRDERREVLLIEANKIRLGGSTSLSDSQVAEVVDIVLDETERAKNSGQST